METAAQIARRLLVANRWSRAAALAATNDPLVANWIRLNPFTKP